MNPQEMIQKLNMFSIPEGGMCAENLRSADFVDTPHGKRRRWTSIYYMLRQGERSRFHRLKADELWTHHMGGAFTIYMVENGVLRAHRLGGNLLGGELPQVLIPAGTVFAATIDGPWGLCGCVSSPGFHNDDLTLLTRSDLGNVRGDSVLIDFLCHP
jgi:predicted cupin superfamily sugar epimerase